MFVYHRLGKLDTLAGLAIRYGVTVSDLKRANGLHSEMGMFALRELKVPKGQLPASHAGFQALLSQKRTPPEISTEASSALDKLRSHYGTGRLLPEAGGAAVAGGEGGGGDGGRADAARGPRRIAAAGGAGAPAAGRSCWGAWPRSAGAAPGRPPPWSPRRPARRPGPTGASPR